MAMNYSFMEEDTVFDSFTDACHLKQVMTTIVMHDGYHVDQVMNHSTFGH